MSTVAKQALRDFFIAVTVCALIVGISLAVAGVYEPTAAKPKDEPGPYNQPSRTTTVVGSFVGGCIIGGMLGAFPGAIIPSRRLSEAHTTNA